MVSASSADRPARPGAGLSSGEAADRLRADGRNMLPQSRPRSPLLALAARMVHFFALMLWVAAALAWVADMPALSAAIGVVVIVNGVFAFAQQYRADRAAAKLEELLPPQVRVMRDGQVMQVSAEELVVGDVVLLEAAWTRTGSPAGPGLRRIPFDPRARCSGAVDDRWIHLLGAAEAVLPRCSEFTAAAVHEAQR